VPRRSVKRYQKANAYVTVMRVPEWDNVPEPHGIPGRATLQEPVIHEYLRGACLLTLSLTGLSSRISQPHACPQF